MASGIQELLQRAKENQRRSGNLRRLSALHDRLPVGDLGNVLLKGKGLTPKVKAATRQLPTAGDWTQDIKYDPDEGVVTVTFKDGFVAEYPNMTLEDYRSMFRGATTKGKPTRGGSVGAWLWKHPNVMHNYRAGK